MARQAEAARLKREAAAQPNAQDQQWVAWTPVTFDFDDAASGAVDPAGEPEAGRSAAKQPEAPPAKEKRGFFGLFGRKKEKPQREAKREAVPVSAPVTPPAPAPQPAPQPEAAPTAAPQPEQATVKLNVKPISWPAPPPPSRNFVHPPQSTIQFAAITPEQIRQAQAARQMQQQNAQRAQAARQPQPAQGAQRAQTAPARPQGAQTGSWVPSAQAEQPSAWQASNTSARPQAPTAGQTPAQPNAPQWQAASGAAGQAAGAPAEAQHSVPYLEAAQKTVPPQRGTPTPYWQD